jgi:hypothetical protein
MKISRPSFEDCGQIGHPPPCVEVRTLALAFGIHENHSDFQLHDRLAGEFGVLSIAEKDGGPAISQECRKLVGVQCRVERHNDAACGDNSKIRGNPPGMIVRNDRQARTSLESGFADPEAN